MLTQKSLARNKRPLSQRLVYLTGGTGLSNPPPLPEHRNPAEVWKHTIQQNRGAQRSTRWSGCSWCPKGNQDGPERGPTAAAGSRARAQGRGAPGRDAAATAYLSGGGTGSQALRRLPPAAAWAGAFPQTRAGRAPGKRRPRRGWPQGRSWARWAPGSAGQPGRAQEPSAGGGRGRGLRGPEPGARPSPRRPAWGGKPRRRE